MRLFVPLARLTTVIKAVNGGHQAPTPSIHMVQAGESISTIAQRYNMTPKELKALNYGTHAILKGDDVAPGKQLLLAGLLVLGLALWRAAKHLAGTSQATVAAVVESLDVEEAAVLEAERHVALTHAANVKTQAQVVAGLLMEARKEVQAAELRLSEVEALRHKLRQSRSQLATPPSAPPHQIATTVVTSDTASNAVPLTPALSERVGRLGTAPLAAGVVVAGREQATEQVGDVGGSTPPSTPPSTNSGVLGLLKKMWSSSPSGPPAEPPVPPPAKAGADQDDKAPTLTVEEKQADHEEPQDIKTEAEDSGTQLAAAAAPPGLEAQAQYTASTAAESTPQVLTAPAATPAPEQQAAAEQSSPPALPSPGSAQDLGPSVEPATAAEESAAVDPTPGSSPEQQTPPVLQQPQAAAPESVHEDPPRVVPAADIDADAGLVAPTSTAGQEQAAASSGSSPVDWHARVRAALGQPSPLPVRDIPQEQGLPGVQPSTSANTALDAGVAGVPVDVLGLTAVAQAVEQPTGVDAPVTVAAETVEPTAIDEAPATVAAEAVEPTAIDEAPATVAAEAVEPTAIAEAPATVAAEAVEPTAIVKALATVDQAEPLHEVVGADPAIVLEPGRGAPTSPGGEPVATQFEVTPAIEAAEAAVIQPNATAIEARPAIEVVTVPVIQQKGPEWPTEEAVLDAPRVPEAEDAEWTASDPTAAADSSTPADAVVGAVAGAPAEPQVTRITTPTEQAVASLSLERLPHAAPSAASAKTTRHVYQRIVLKASLLSLIAATARGTTADSQQRAAVDELVTILEGCTPNSRPAECLDLLDGRWKLVYTSSPAAVLLLTALDALPVIALGDVYQDIDISAMTVQTKIDVKLPVQLSLRAAAQLTARSLSVLRMRVTRVGLDTYIEMPNLLPDLEIPEHIQLWGNTLDLSAIRRTATQASNAVAAQAYAILQQAAHPDVDVSEMGEAAEAWMLTTYLDETLHITRDDMGRVYILTKDAVL